MDEAAQGRVSAPIRGVTGSASDPTTVQDRDEVALLAMPGTQVSDVRLDIGGTARGIEQPMDAVDEHSGVARR